jgi:hypothetical protein
MLRLAQITVMKDGSWPSLKEMSKYGAWIFHTRLQALRTKPTHNDFRVCGNCKSAEGRNMSRQLWRFISNLHKLGRHPFRLCAWRRCLRTASEFAVATPKCVVWTVSNPYFHQNVDIQYSGMERRAVHGIGRTNYAVRVEAFWRTSLIEIVNVNLQSRLAQLSQGKTDMEAL